MVGTWKILDAPDCKLPQKLATAYSELLGIMIGATYTPMLYAATQLVNGTNHLIISKQVLVTPELVEHLVYVIIFESPQGEFAVTKIQTIV